MPREGSEPPENGIERTATDLARYALACNAAGKPIRREGIRDSVMAGSGVRNMKQVLDSASQLLEQTLGLKMVALPPHEKTLLGNDAQQTSTASSAASKSANKWMLVSALPDDVRSRLDPAQSSRNRAITGFAAVVLSLIFVNNMSIPAEQLILYVRKMGPPDCVLASSTDAEHGVGRGASSDGITDAQMESAAREAIDYLARVGFLDKVSVHAQIRMDSAVNTQATHQQQQDDAASDAAFEYTWGPQAKIRFAPLDMARFVAAMTGEECSTDFVKTISRAYGRPIGSS
ncbi:hypothetical protein IW140_003408 [Coemansia sp. RSA 1813]|nr:hypothetical protein EV178_003225 [Coemansia sp. RSA 1646]KAJ1771033.1 hypothetical protein LPJ74_002724 [Coemansia sp. RSA 1843]KAJ2089272.1 hypothetical protein IW138_003592 [Coemansia sp. RSA 986]KAJ2215101.1 hypothetical protein EV179_002469 [Coemansia sp. RSA 487]KAJ2569043.1 hypothetical protein IW140_003408 [Coemansia sp. RSA 1813]